MDASARDKALLNLLDDSALANSRIWPSLLKNAVIPTRAGSLKKASDLYDPNNRSLHSLLEGTECFPDKRYTSKQTVSLFDLKQEMSMQARLYTIHDGWQAKCELWDAEMTCALFPAAMHTMASGLSS